MIDFCRIISILFLILFGHTSHLCIAQNRNIDSLRQIFDASTDDSLRLHMLKQLSWNYLRIDPEESKRLSEQMLRYGDSVGIHSKDAVALNHIGIYYFIKGDDKLAIDYYGRGYARAVELKDTVSIAATINNQGGVYRKLGLYAKAFEQFKRGAELTKQIGYDNDYCTALSNIGTILREMEEWDQASDYYLQAIEVAEEVGNRNTLFLAKVYLGNIAEKQGRIQEAETYYRTALKGYQEDGDLLGLARVYVNLGRVTRLKENYSHAIIFLDSAITLAARLAFVDLEMEATLEKTYLLLEQRRYRQALYLIDQFIDEPSISLNTQTLQDYHWIRSQCYEGLRQYPNAYASYIQYSQLKDSLSKESKTKTIAGIEIMYQSEQKETENQLLKEQQKKNEASLRQRNTVLFATILVLILIVILALIVYNNYRTKLANNLILEEMVAQRTEELEESNKNLARFASITSHDLKEPIRNMIGFVQLIDRKVSTEYGENADLKEYSDFVVRNAKQMHTLIEDVKIFTTIEEETKDIHLLSLSAVVSRVEDALRERMLATHTEIRLDGLDELYGHESLLFLVMKNLIENAIKYNQSNAPQIHISVDNHKGGSLISVADNGIGIEAKYQNQIFDMFSRLHDRSQYDGSGLGLSISKKIVKQLRGDIWVNSELGKGSTFFIWLPGMSKGL